MNKKIFVILPGRFHPFHKGHKGVYTYLSSKYGGAHVYVTTTDKVELPKSPFSFEEKKRMMVLTGIPANKIINVINNYNLVNLVGKIPIDINRDVIIFAVSEKDMQEDPRFGKFTKKDGSPSYLQPIPKKLDNLEPAITHGYIDTVPTTDFTVLGMPARSASQLRARYSTLSLADRKKFIVDLFGKYDDVVFNIMNAKLTDDAPLQAALSEKHRKLLKKLIVGILKEDERDIQTATRKANLALKNQRKIELDDVKQKLAIAKDKISVATSPEEKKSAEEEVKKLTDLVRSKDEMYKAASKQAVAI